MFEIVQARNTLLADRAYDSGRLLRELKVVGAWACIRLMPSRVHIPFFNQ
ncbi:hypothetical protein QE433_001965 [Agrobacterium tumefaciens]|nr:hypothetical protein [Agrobacterium tumefaciens]